MCTACERRQQACCEHSRNLQPAWCNCLLHHLSKPRVHTCKLLDPRRDRRWAASSFKSLAGGHVRHGGQTCVLSTAKYTQAFSLQSQGFLSVCNMQMRNFEKLGMTREQSERLTRDLTEILCINKDKIAAQFVSKSTLEKVRCMLALL